MAISPRARAKMDPKMIYFGSISRYNRFVAITSLLGGVRSSYFVWRSNVGSLHDIVSMVFSQCFSGATRGDEIMNIRKDRKGLQCMF